MRKLIVMVVIAGALVGGYFMFRHKVLFLDSFTGTLEKKIKSPSALQVGDSVSLSSLKSSKQNVLMVRTEDDRLVRVFVDSLTFEKFKEGQDVSKPFFSFDLVSDEE